MLDLSIILVGYNSCGALQKCLRSVYAQTSGTSFEVILVDNGSADGTEQMITAEFPSVKFVQNGRNRGFGAAVNQGIRETQSRCVLLLNPDAEIVNGAIQKTVRFFDEHPKAGIVGCSLKYPDGRIQASAYSFPTVWNMLSEATFLYKFFPKTRLFGGYHLTYLNYSQPVQVDWLIGAFFLIRREVIESIGLLDEQYFMYAEDTDYCYQAKKAGFEVWLTPEAEVFHIYGGISGINLRAAVWVQRGQVLFYKKNFTPLRAWFLIAVKYFGLVLRVFLYLVMGLCTVNRKQFDKAWYATYSIYRMLTSRWEYNPNYRGEVLPWEV